jgi:hypothetical protein
MRNLKEKKELGTVLLDYALWIGSMKVQTKTQIRSEPTSTQFQTYTHRIQQMVS